jgi:hypothetical protein
MLLLAEWSTLVAALGGSVIGATAAMIAGYFALRGTTLNVRYQEREAWRGRLIEAATDFSAKYHETVVLMARWVDEEGDEEGDEARTKRLEEIRESGRTAVASETLLALLFGPESPPANAATQITAATTRAARRMRDFPDNGDQAARREIFDALDIDEVHETFLRGVHALVRPMSVE